MATMYDWSGAGGFAQFYESYFVPALFGAWGDLTVAAGNIQPGERVLDVACGTGVVARRALEFTGSVTGVDLSEDMLSVASKKEPRIDWKMGDATSLAFPANAFDVVFSQFALMFFTDRISALKEMRRVGGRVIVAVWESLDRSPGYREFVELLNRDHGAESAEILSSPFCLGKTDELIELFRAAGLEPAIETKQTVARFPSIQAWVTTDIRATPLSAMFDDQQLGSFIESARTHLSAYENTDGTVSFPALAHIITCS